MKCPNCSVAIHENLSRCQIGHRDDLEHGGNLEYAIQALYQVCPECKETIIFLQRYDSQELDDPILVYPKTSSRPVPPEVTDPYKQDFREACLVVSDSPKASAALSRRCLQAILKDKGGAKQKDLNDQINEVAPKLPSHIADELHSLRNIGNFAAHPQKSQTTGMIVDVEAGEAEWSLDVLESLFDFYFVQPAKSAARKVAFNKKLQQVGKPPVK